jgi:hypothetical protein
LIFSKEQGEEKMTQSEGKDDRKIEIRDVSGQVAIGDNNIQSQTIETKNVTVSEAELKALQKMFENVKDQIVEKAPEEKKKKALEKVSELEEAIKTEKPDLTTMEYVKNWFEKNLPQLAGAVTGLVVNPIVGKLVEVAGETLAQEFKHRFGGAS